MPISAPFFRLFLVILSAALLSGCLRTLSNITDRTTMFSDDGVIVINVRTNIEGSSLLLYEKGEHLPGYDINTKSINDIKVFKLRGGDYYIGKITHGQGFVYGRCLNFSVQPGTITYIGDLVIEWSVEKGQIVASQIAIDREAETIVKAKGQYPWIFEKYTYKKDILK
jgi:hypothetical protein